MASHVRKNLTEKIKKAKYYDLIFDSTPDQAHREQVSEVKRLVIVDFDKKTVLKSPFWVSFKFIKKVLQASLKLLCKNCRRMR